MGSVAPEVRSITTDETRNVAIDCSDMLDSGELLTGTPMIQCSASLTITNQQVNASAVVINGQSVAAGKAIQFTVTSGTPGSYAVEAKCSTDGSQVIEGRLKLLVEKTKF